MSSLLSFIGLAVVPARAGHAGGDAKGPAVTWALAIDGQAGGAEAIGPGADVIGARCKLSATLFLRGTPM